MLTPDRIAGLLAAQINDQYGVIIGTDPIDATTGSDGSSLFALPIQQDLGVFKMIVKSTKVSVNAGEVEDPQNGKVTCVRASLDYEHSTGGRNGHTIGSYWFKEDGSLLGSREG